MRLSPMLAGLLVAIAVPAVGLGGSAVSSAAAAGPRLVAFGGHFGGGHFGGSRFGAGRRGLGGGGFLGARRGRSHRILRHVAHALIFASILHLLFSHGGISILIWLIVIALVVALFRRRRRRRYAYAG